MVGDREVTHAHISLNVLNLVIGTYIHRNARICLACVEKIVFDGDDFNYGIERKFSINGILLMSSN